MAGLGDANPLAGAITYIGPVASWLVNTTTGFGETVRGPVAMDLVSGNVAPFGGFDPLTVSLTQTGLWRW